MMNSVYESEKKNVNRKISLEIALSAILGDRYIPMKGLNTTCLDKPKLEKATLVSYD